MTPNPEYESAELEAACLDSEGNRMSKAVVCLLFDRVKPPRYKRNPDGSITEVFPFLDEKKDS